MESMENNNGQYRTIESKISKVRANDGGWDIESDSTLRKAHGQIGNLIDSAQF